MGWRTREAPTDGRDPLAEEDGFIYHSDDYGSDLCLLDGSRSPHPERTLLSAVEETHRPEVAGMNFQPSDSFTYTKPVEASRNTSCECASESRPTNDHPAGSLTLTVALVNLTLMSAGLWIAPYIERLVAP